MALWMVRSGKYGEREQFNIESSVVSIGWKELPNLTQVSERSALSSLMVQHNPDKSAGAIANWVGQVWTFAKVIQVGDLVSMPLKTAPAILFGKVVGNYEYSAGFPAGAEHYRRVEWIKTISRTSIDPDLLFSFGAIMTVCNIGRNDAENRIRALLENVAPPPLASGPIPDSHGSDVAPATVTAVDLEEVLRDAIRSYIARKFAGHGLAELVEAVLRAQGYRTLLWPPGPDGGVDVLARQGPEAFDGAKLAVQVKSGSIEVDTNVFRLFQTAMHEFGAEYGLIVSWGGFRPPVLREKARHFFKIRMWGEDDLIEAILENYDSLPASMQARLPLKKTWLLIVDEDD